MLTKTFFDADPQDVAKRLLGKVIRVKYQQWWLSVRIIETEAYYLQDKASHASLGFTEKRKALFMPAGTIYMYYARGGDSLNVSCRGEGNAVLIKSGYPDFSLDPKQQTLAIMQSLNPTHHFTQRPMEKLCSGQTLLCRSLGLKVREWDQKNFQAEKFFLEDDGRLPTQVIQARRLGIPAGRDEHLLYRFIDKTFASYCSENPLKKRGWQQEKDYYILRVC